MMKHEVGEYWKTNWCSAEPYSVQFPNHIEGAKNKTEAERKSQIAIAWLEKINTPKKDIVKISFAKDEKTGRKLVLANCNNGATYVQTWSELSDEMHMILRAIANPDMYEIEILEKGFDDIEVDK